MRQIERVIVIICFILFASKEVWLLAHNQWEQIVRDCFSVGAVAFICFVIILKRRSAIRRSEECTRQMLQREIK